MPGLNRKTRSSKKGGGDVTLFNFRCSKCKRAIGPNPDSMCGECKTAGQGGSGPQAETIFGNSKSRR